MRFALFIIILCATMSLEAQYRTRPTTVKEATTDIIAYVVTCIVMGIVGGICVAIIADSKYYNPINWFFYGFFLFPIALTHIIVAERKEPDKPAKEGEWQPRIR